MIHFTYTHKTSIAMCCSNRNCISYTASTAAHFASHDWKNMEKQAEQVAGECERRQSLAKFFLCRKHIPWKHLHVLRSIKRWPSVRIYAVHCDTASSGDAGVAFNSLYDANCNPFILMVTGWSYEYVVCSRGRHVKVTAGDETTTRRTIKTF